MYSHLLLCLLSLIFFLFSLLQAGIIYVPNDTTSIQGGIYLASDGDTVLVAEDTYYENINFRGKAITVASEFIMDGDKVKVTMMFRGREITHSDIGWGLLKKIVDQMKGLAMIEKQPSMEGQRMYIILSPAPAQQAKAKEEVQKSQDAKNENT